MQEKEEIKMQQEKTLKEESFVKLFLTLLCKNGIFKITEDEVSKKLYCYRKKKEYKELFQDITSSTDFVNITEGIRNEVYFANNILVTNTTPPGLILLYDAAIETESLKEEFKIGDNTLSLMEKMASEIAMMKKVERHSKALMNIFNNNPNKEYTLTSGKYHSKVLTWDLITDGVVQEIRPLNLKVHENWFSKEPGSKISNCVKLIKLQGKSVTIENASYAVLQGKVNEKVKEIELHTEQMDMNYLKSIREIAQQVYNEENEQFEKPTVKRMILK